MRFSKYFWDLNERALKETEKILKDSRHPKFAARLVTFLSRCDRPKELFSLVSRHDFIEFWPKVRSYWLKIARVSDFRAWWETVYEQLLEEYSARQKRPKGKTSALFLKIGRLIRKARVQKGLSQRELAFRVRMRQPDISTIEKGEKNITLETLIRLCKTLEIKKLELD
jgi:DNA-binding Xre family transcriptional regulator